MDFSETDRVKAVAARVRKIVDERIIPLEAEIARVGSFRAMLPELEAVRDEVRREGLFAPHFDAAYGGMGLTLTEFARVSEELGRSPFGHYCFNCQAPDVGNMEILHSHGSEQQKKTFLDPLARGKIRSCFSMTEPDRAGSNPTWLDTRAERDGDHWVINGRKWFTSSADGAAFAIVMAVTRPDGEPHLRASQIIVPADTPGFKVVRNIPVMGEAGDDYASHAEVVYEDCRVPVENLLGPENGGFFMAQERLGPGRIHHAMRWIGISERAFSLMCQRAATREVAPGKVLGSKQLVQSFIAESRAEIDAARLYVLHTAFRIEREGAQAARDGISGIKFFVADVMSRVLDRAIQVWGASGLTDETPLGYWYRHERGAHIYDGADEVHKVSMAKRILRGYGVAL